MPNRTVVCVRHGETRWKVEGRTQGQLDSPLTARGIGQVRALAAELTSESFDMILSSPLGRTLQTAAILAHHLDIADLRQSAHLAERGEGAFQGLTRAQQSEQFPQCFERETGRLLADLIPGGESTADFLIRVALGLREIERLSHSADLLVVTHAGVLQALLALLANEELETVSERQHFGFCAVLRLSLAELCWDQIEQNTGRL